MGSVVGDVGAVADVVGESVGDDIDVDVVVVVDNSMLVGQEEVTSTRLSFLALDSPLLSLEGPWTNSEALLMMEEVVNAGATAKKIRRLAR